MSSAAVLITPLFAQEVAPAVPEGSFSEMLIRAVESPLCWAVVLLGLGMWLLLPRGRERGRRLGALVALAGFVVMGTQLPRLAPGADASVFWVLATVTVASCVASVTSRNPVYAAIWFGMALLGTAGLFLYQGAQFLAVATVVVYAGAILVTFLFVLMLAQPEGHAYYDRLSFEALLSAATGAVMVGMLTVSVGQGLEASSSGPVAEAAGDRATKILADQHVAQLGGELFSRHLVAVEVAGTLLLAALVGAVAMVAHGRQQAQADRPAASRAGGDDG